MAWISLCDLSELTEDQGKYVEIDGYQLAVFRHGPNVYALDNNCPHAGGPLAEGTIEDNCCVCPWHSWSFHLENGQLRDAPGVVISTYKTRLLERPDLPTLVQAELPVP
ncbi:MAG: Rieske 2Fe-2S domain-containing protein [Tepidisphaeraceae bacterium]|jgi:NAD(P)H-dependent nitrite reductase small subunit